MCDLTCNNCGCGSNNSCIWIILILLFCCGNGNSVFSSSDGCGCGCGNDNNCIWIIILLLLFCNNGSTWGCNNCGNNCGNTRDNCGCC